MTVSPEAAMLVEIISRRLAKIQRPHVHTYRHNQLPANVHIFFEDVPEDLGGNDYEHKWRHIIRPNATVTRIASIQEDYLTRVIYYFQNNSSNVHLFAQFTYGDGMPTEILELEDDDIPAWAALAFFDKLQNNS